MIKVTLGEVKTQEEKPFPKLMKSDEGEIFYMVREKYGLPLTHIVQNDWSFDEKYFADFSTNYREFTDYNEPITIQNA